MSYSFNTLEAALAIALLDPDRLLTGSTGNNSLMDVEPPSIDASQLEKALAVGMKKQLAVPKVISVARSTAVTPAANTNTASSASAKSTLKQTKQVLPAFNAQGAMAVKMIRKKRTRMMRTMWIVM